MARNNSTDMRSALEAFMAANPDLEENMGTFVVSDESDSIKQTSRIDIILEKKRRAGKQATILSGFDGSDDELQNLASDLKRKLGTGGSARGGEILIQGDRRKEVLDILVKRGYKARII